MLRAWPWALLILAVASGSLWGGGDGPDAKEPPRPEMDIRFLDGSSARVFVLDESLELETKYGKLAIPCRDIRRIDLSLRAAGDIEKRVAAAIEQLGSANFQQREAASKELLKLAIPAYHALKKLPPSKDAEVNRRTLILVKEIEKSVAAERLQGRTQDRVQTTEFTITGRLTAHTLKVRSRHFGEADLKLHELDYFGALATLPYSTQPGVFRAAYLYELGDHQAAQQTMEVFAKGKHVEDLAVMFRRRPFLTRPGVGIGPRPGEVKPDGIEQMIATLASEQRPLPPNLLRAHHDDLARAFYLTAAIGEGHRYHSPVKVKEGKKDPRDWERFSVTMRDLALELAKAVRDRQSTANIRAAARKLDNACASCHEIFRECN